MTAEPTAHTQTFEGIEEQNRFLQAQVHDLTRELEQSRDEIKNLQTIFRAKLVLIEKEKLSEQEAHSFLQKTAMKRGLKMVQVAQMTLDLHTLE